MSGQPSLSSSKIATPVPVVSMMYFFVSTPPKIVIALRPALSAMSTKFAICLESSDSCGADVTWPGDTNARIQRNTRTKPQTVADLMRGNGEHSARIRFVIDSTSNGSLQGAVKVSHSFILSVGLFSLFRASPTSVIGSPRASLLLLWLACPTTSLQTPRLFCDRRSADMPGSEACVLAHSQAGDAVLPAARQSPLSSGLQQAPIFPAPNGPRRCLDSGG